MSVAFAPVSRVRAPLASLSVLSETFGERIARLRERQRGLTQARLAELAGDGITESWIAAVEKDRIENPLREKARIRAIAKVLGVSVNYLTEPLGIAFIDEAPEETDLEKLDAAEGVLVGAPLSDDVRDLGMASLRVVRQQLTTRDKQAG